VRNGPDVRSAERVGADFRATRALFLIAAAAVSATLIYLVATSAGGALTFSLIVGMALAGVAGWLVARPPELVRSRRLPGVLAMLSALAFFVAVPELCLRAAGFRFESGVIEFAPFPAAFARYAPDAVLLWRWDPQYRLNSYGYPADEPRVPKPRDVFRILHLGDSCSYAEIGPSPPPNYPALADAMLAPIGSRIGQRVDTVNLALPGYSSHQGRMLANRYGQRLQPDLVVVYFGWNDHWPAFGAVDADKKVAVTTGQLARASARVTQEVRLVQALAWFLARVRGPQVPIDALRVPIDAYTTNLEWIGDHFTRLGAIPLFITAPTSHYRLGVPQGLVRANFGPDGKTILARHREYNERVRALTKRHGWHLLDLEREMDGAERIDRLFVNDGIHFSTAGKAYVASELSRYVAGHILHAQ
jgi:lysophospholipase L1-like esterase